MKLTNQTNTVDNPTENSQINNSKSTDQTESRPSVPNTKNTISSDHKYDIVIYSIKECPGGTLRSECSKHDVNDALSIFSMVDNNLHPLSIRDCLQLGKYKELYPRPILTKINRLIHVSSISSKCSDLPPGITVKLNMTLQQQHAEVTLLKDRWSLTQ